MLLHIFGNIILRQNYYKYFPKKKKKKMNRNVVYNERINNLFILNYDKIFKLHTLNSIEEF